jgi:hypothetical protein
LVGVLLVRGTEPTGYILFYGKGNNKLELFSFVHKRISAVNMVEFFTDRMSSMVLRGHWYHILLLNIHAPTGDKNNVKGSFNSFKEELDHVR